ncbi:MAG: YceI family protein [Pseudomonadota bacterium]
MKRAIRTIASATALLATAALAHGCGEKAASAAASGDATAATPNTSSIAPSEVAAASAEAAPSGNTENAGYSAWAIDYAASAIKFTGTQTGDAFTGAFEKWTATVVLDPNDLENASIKAVIDLASAKTGDTQRDRALPGADWFDVKSAAEATFTSTSIAATADGGYAAIGALSIKGASKDITLPFTLTIDGDTATAEAATSLLRTDFNVGQGEFAEGKWVGLDVGVAISIAAARS